MMQKMNIPMPDSDMAATIDEALVAAGRIGYR